MLAPERTRQGRERIKAGCEGRLPAVKKDGSSERGSAANKGPWPVSNFVHKGGKERCVYGGLPMAQPTVAAGRSGHRMHTVLADCNVGLLVWAGRSGGGGLAPSSGGTRRTRLPMNCSCQAAVEGGEGQTDCAGDQSPALCKNYPQADLSGLK